MKVLNAKHSMLSFILGNEQTISVAPGKFSETFVADKNVILALIKGNQVHEVGFVLGNPYELEIAKQVSGCVPYLYNSEEES
jgi:hypothetical protein